MLRRGGAERRADGRHSLVMALPGDGIFPGDGMMSRRTIGPNIAWAVAIAPVLLAAVTSAPLSGRGAEAVVPIRLGQFAALGGMALLSVSFVLSSRARFLEDYFGGLDGMYRTHHTMGLTAFGLLCLHPIALAARFLPADVTRSLLFVLPVHGRWTVNVGVWALWGLVVLMALTLYTRFPYDLWKRSHQLLGLVLVAGLVHMLGVGSTRGLPVLVAESLGLRVYMVGLAGLGLVGALYKLVVVPRQAGNHRYVVDATHNLNDEVMEIELVPQHPDENIGFFPGQFVWVTFEHEDLSREAHPFTICSPAGASRLRLTVKALGDFTSDLHRHLTPETPVRVEGPYGRFDYRQGAPKQVWIAGGVGVAPFLSWARHMAETDDRTHDVEFYYCVHSRGDAVHLEELQSIGDALPTLKIALVCSVEDGHLHAEEVADLDDRDIFLCGPQRLTQDLTQQFRTLGVSRGRIHAEDFEFRGA